MTFQSSSNNFHSFQGLDGMELAKWVKLCSIPFSPLLILLNPNNEFYLPLHFIPSYSTNLNITFVTFIPSHSTKSYECFIWSSFIARYIHLWKSQKLWLDSGINLQHLLFDKGISKGFKGTMELLGSKVNASIDIFFSSINNTCLLFLRLNK